MQMYRSGTRDLNLLLSGIIALGIQARLDAGLTPFIPRHSVQGVPHSTAQAVQDKAHHIGRRFIKIRAGHHKTANHPNLIIASADADQRTRPPDKPDKITRHSATDQTETAHNAHNAHEHQSDSGSRQPMKQSLNWLHPARSHFFQNN